MWAAVALGCLPQDGEVCCLCGRAQLCAGHALLLACLLHAAHCTCVLLGPRTMSDLALQGGPPGLAAAVRFSGGGRASASRRHKRPKYASTAAVCRRPYNIELPPSRTGTGACKCCSCPLALLLFCLVKSCASLQAHRAVSDCKLVQNAAGLKCGRKADSTEFEGDAQQGTQQYTVEQRHGLAPSQMHEELARSIKRAQFCCTGSWASGLGQEATCESVRKVAK